MSLVLNLDAKIECGHEGTFTLLPGTGKAKVEGAEIVTESVLQAVVIAGCTNTVSPNLPCLAIASIIAGQADKLKVSGQKAMTEDMEVLTSGSDPSSSFVDDAGQTKLDTA